MKQLLSLLRSALSIAVHYSSPRYASNRVLSTSRLQVLVESSPNDANKFRLEWKPVKSTISRLGQNREYKEDISRASLHEILRNFLSSGFLTSIRLWKSLLQNTSGEIDANRNSLRNDWGIICSTAHRTARDCNCGTWWSHPQRWRRPVSRSYLQCEFHYSTAFVLNVMALYSWTYIHRNRSIPPYLQIRVRLIAQFWGLEIRQGVPGWTHNRVLAECCVCGTEHSHSLFATPVDWKCLCSVLRCWFSTFCVSFGEGALDIPWSCI